MHFLFQHRTPEVPTIEPVRTVFPEIDGASMAAVFVGQRVAGDFYDTIRANPHRILFGLLDVAGRRGDTREILSAAQNTFRTAGAQLFVQSDINESEAMTELSHLLNKKILETAGAVRSCPAFLGLYDEQSGTLCYTNAGHTPGLLRDSSGVAELPSTGLPLGLFSHATSDAPTVGLAPGAALLLVSRGVVEGGRKHPTVKDIEFGLEQVKELFLADPLTEPQSVCVSILNAIGETQTTAVNDDRTALAFLRKV
jgi:sigma-B regulation protein RsbU (phosphoserine phosphatase)